MNCDTAGASSTPGVIKASGIRFVAQPLAMRSHQPKVRKKSSLPNITGVTLPSETTAARNIELIIHGGMYGRSGMRVCSALSFHSMERNSRNRLIIHLNPLLSPPVHGDCWFRDKHLSYEPSAERSYKIRIFPGCGLRIGTGISFRREDPTAIVLE